jgi:hypothetical protein
MSERIKCPSCGAGLILSQTAGEWRATCPRCLAEINVPEAQPAPDAVQEQKPAPRRDASSCPHCGRAVEAAWLTCPWCDEPLRGRQRPHDNRPDLDVRRDAQRTSGFVILLAGIGVLGVVLIAAYRLMDWSALLVALLFVGGFSTLIAFISSHGRLDAAGFRRIAVSTFAIAGGAILMVLFGLASIVIFFMVVCGPMLRH